MYYLCVPFLKQRARVPNRSYRNVLGRYEGRERPDFPKYHNDERDKAMTPSSLSHYRCWTKHADQKPRKGGKGVPLDSKNFLKRAVTPSGSPPASFHVVFPYPFVSSFVNRQNKLFRYVIFSKIRWNLSESI